MVVLVRGLLVVLLLFAPVIRGVARAQDDVGYGEDPEAAAAPGDYEAALAPYGSWIEDDQYGEVWEPAVPIGWAPYVDGYWSWTPYGWTWVSQEPWAWTLHYGRWALLPSGWAWVPGSVWGPAWVDWFWADGFVGWAPLAPFATQVTVIDTFVFCHERDFGAHGLVHAVVDHHLLPDRVIHRWQHRDPEHQRPPAVHHVERVSQHQITRLDQRPPGTLAPRFALPRRQVVRAAREPERGGPHRLGHAWAPGGLRPGEATLGHPWEPGRITPVPRAGGSPLTESRVPRLATPRLAPALGGARRAPPAAVGRLVPRHSVTPPAPGLTGARRPEGGRGLHRPQASQGLVGAR